MKYSLSDIIKDLLAKIPVLENRINTLSTKITNINNKVANIEEVDFDSRILTFDPIFQFFDMNHQGGHVTKNGIVQTTGEIQISYAEHSGKKVLYNSQHGASLLLGKIPLIGIDKSATISGGYQYGPVASVSPDSTRLVEVAVSYIREHLDEFKAKAFNAIPESRNAIEFKIMPTPDYIQMEGYARITIDILTPMGNGLGGSSGHVYIGDKTLDYDNKWTSISYIEDYLRNEYLPEHNFRGAFYGGIIANGRSAGDNEHISGFVMCDKK